MWRVKEFLKENYKIVLIIIFVLALILAIVITNVSKKNKLEEYVQVEYNYFAMYSTDEKVGVVDKKGNKILDTNYSDIFIPNPSKPVFICYENATEYKILNEKGEELFTNFDKVEAMQTSESNLDFEKTFLKFKKNDKYGLIDFNGNEIIPAEYESIESLKYRPGEILVKKDEQYGVIGTDGNIKIAIKYDSIMGDEYFTTKYGYGETGYIVGEKTDEGYLYGYLNNFAEEVLEVKYESVTRVLKYDNSDAYLIVMNNGKKGVYKNDKEIISQNYQNITYTENSNVFVAKRNSKYGIFNVDGKEILPVEYKAYSLAGDYISVENDDEEKELYDVNGNKISNLRYKSIQSSGNTECYIAIDENGYYSLITKEETISNNYTYISFAFDNYFIFKNEEGNYGLLNIYSGVEIEPEYNFMLVIDGKNMVEAEKLDGTVDIYSKDIEKVLTMSGAIVENIDENYTIIFSDTETKYLNKNGKIVENTEVFPDNKIYTYTENGQWGFKDKSGKIIIEAKYDFATELNEYGFAGIVKNGEWGVINENGNVVTEPIYEIDTYYLPEFIGIYLLELTDTYHCLELE